MKTKLVLKPYSCTGHRWSKTIEQNHEKIPSRFFPEMKTKRSLLYVFVSEVSRWPHFNSIAERVFLWHVPLFIKLNFRAWKGIFRLTTGDTMIWRKASKKLWTIMGTLKINRKWLARRWMTWEFDGGLWTAIKTRRKIGTEKELFFAFSDSKIREFLDH